LTNKCFYLMGLFFRTEEEVECVIENKNSRCFENRKRGRSKKYNCVFVVSSFKKSDIDNFFLNFVVDICDRYYRHLWRTQLPRDRLGAEILRPLQTERNETISLNLVHYFFTYWGYVVKSRFTIFSLQWVIFSEVFTLVLWQGLQNNVITSGIG